MKRWRVRAYDPVLGVGIHYDSAWSRFCTSHAHLVDFVSVDPQRLCSEIDRDTPQRFIPLPSEVAAIDALAERRPVIAHGVALDGDFERVIHWRGRFDFRWVVLHARGPTDESTLARLVVGAQARLDCRVVIADVHPALANRICAATGCGAVLDLRDDPALDPRHVQEIRVAGSDGSMRLDAPHGVVPRATWRALDRLLPQLPKLRAITLVLDESQHASLGADGVAAQLELARAAWNRYRTPRR
ncbi:MAG TPA: hypothetical protein VG755_25805 [Nannocystaceae bacterium]|nr:hypothetical protein [Nannocystaceae bacterium]